MDMVRGLELILNKRFLLNPPLKKGDIGGFALERFGEIPQPPFTKGGILFTDKFLFHCLQSSDFFRVLP